MTSPREQKLRITGPVVVTANRLADGAVIYRAADGSWATQLDRAAIATSPAVAQELLAAANSEDIRAVDPYVAPVKLDADGSVRPGNLREAIRAAGPTIDFDGA
jgi:predicted nucleic acid-binding protein